MISSTVGNHVTLSSTNSVIHQNIWVENTSVIEQIFRVRTDETSRWKRNAREWLPRQTEHNQTADRVILSGIVSVFEQIGCRT